MTARSYFQHSAFPYYTTIPNMAVDPTVNRGQTVMPAGSTLGRSERYGEPVAATMFTPQHTISGAWPTPTEPPQNRYTEDYDFDAEAALMEACRLLRILNQLDNLPATTRVWFMGRQMREDDEVEAVRKRAEVER